MTYFPFIQRPASFIAESMTRILDASKEERNCYGEPIRNLKHKEPNDFVEDLDDYIT